MNSFEQFYIELYSYNNKLVPNVYDNATHFTNLNKTFDCVTIVRDLHSRVVLPSLLYFSSVPFR
jgi:hypothetical protein